MKKLIFILVLLLISCGSRKVATNNAKIKKDSTAVTEVKVEKEIKAELEEKTNVFVFEECEEIEISPIDTSKVISVNGKTYKNVVIRAKKKKSGSLYTNTIKASQTQRIDSTSKSVVVKKEQTNIKTKNVDKKAAIDLHIIWWIIFVVIIFFIFRLAKAFNKTLL